MNKFFNIHNFAIENKMSRNTVMRELEMFLNEIENANSSMNRVLNHSDIDFKIVTVKEMSVRFEKVFVGVRIFTVALLPCGYVMRARNMVLPAEVSPTNLGIWFTASSWLCIRILRKHGFPCSSTPL